ETIPSQGLICSGREPSEGMPSAKLGHWRKAKKARTSSTISQYHPPPPTKTVGGGGRISREICRFFTLRAIIWRRGVKSPRKMQILAAGWTATRLAVLEPPPSGPDLFVLCFSQLGQVPKPYCPIMTC